MIRRKPMPSKKEINSALEYSTKTGEFKWKDCENIKFSPHLINKIAGRIANNGYREIKLNQTMYLAHRLAWFLIHGTQPEFIDHVDGNKKNNRISNLRASDVRSNGSNRMSHRHGKLVGAHFSTSELKWKSQIQINKKKIPLGTFKTELEAHRAYMKAVAGLVEGRDK